MSRCIDLTLTSTSPMAPGISNEFGNMPQQVCSTSPYVHLISPTNTSTTCTNIECESIVYHKCVECKSYHPPNSTSHSPLLSSPLEKFVVKMTRDPTYLQQFPPNEEEKKLQKFIQEVRRNKLKGTYEYARRTAEVMREIILLFDPKHDRLSTLIGTIRRFGRKIIIYLPTIFVIGNLIRRVLFVVREEIHHIVKGEKVVDEVYHKRNLSDYFSADLSSEKELRLGTIEFDLRFSPEDLQILKKKLVTEVNEMIGVMRDSLDLIASSGVKVVQNNEVILTVGFSYTVFNFIQKAVRKKIALKIIVTEHAPDLSGHEMAKKLGELGLETVLIPDAAIYAVMSRVNKVIIGTRSVMANGGLIAESGSHVVSIAAKKHNVPFVVLTALYKLTPQYPTEKYLTNKLINPNDILDCQEQKNITVVNPEFDYVNPELVSLFVTNDGIHNPTYIYRLLMELYDPEDYKM